MVFYQYLELNQQVRTSNPRQQTADNPLLTLGYLTAVAASNSKHVFPQKLVSRGGLDVCSRCLAPFEISVLGDGRAAPAVSEPQERERTGHPLRPSHFFFPLKDN